MTDHAEHCASKPSVIGRLGIISWLAWRPGNPEVIQKVIASTKQLEYAGACVGWAGTSCLVVFLTDQSDATRGGSLARHRWNRRDLSVHGCCFRGAIDDGW